MRNVTCHYCNSKAYFKSSKVIYGKCFGMVYICSNFPECDAYVGVHKGTKTPLGILANKELRELKKKCHALFDPLWKNGEMNRKEAYQYLANQLDIVVSKCHIGMFNNETCLKAIKILEEE